jgi:large subunit ribosomal protein L13
MSSYLAKPLEVERRWFVVDASGQVLGRMASRIAAVIRGKHRATYTPHVDTGDFVVVVNASKVQLTGAKLDKNFYYTHSRSPGGFKARSYRTLSATRPEVIVKKAVKGMLPNTPLSRAMLSKLKVYGGATHPHAAQNPQALKV